MTKKNPTATKAGPKAGDSLDDNAIGLVNARKAKGQPLTPASTPKAKWTVDPTRTFDTLPPGRITTDPTPGSRAELRLRWLESLGALNKARRVLTDAQDDVKAKEAGVIEARRHRSFTDESRLQEELAKALENREAKRAIVQQKKVALKIAFEAYGAFEEDDA